jgi:PPOX class probable F420-dependent enzyme
LDTVLDVLNDAARAALTAGRLAHLVTLNRDGSPQISLVLVGLDGDDVVCAHGGFGQKIRNLQRDPRVALSVETDGRDEMGHDHYIVVHGTARVTEGGAAALLARLAQAHLGPSAPPPPDGLPGGPGWVIRIRVDRLGGVGPWAAGSASRVRS